MTLYKLSHFLGDGNKYHEHFINTEDPYGQEWLNSFIEDAKTNPHPDYALRVEVFEFKEKFTIRPHQREIK